MQGHDAPSSGRALDPERARALLFQCARRVTTAVTQEWRADWTRFGVETGMGADGTPTKYIDQLAEDIILDTIKSSGMQLNVLSEECGFLDNGSDYTVVMDPIDGTRNATHNIPFFCVSLAIGRKSVGDIEYALIRNLSNEDTFWARKGTGAALNGEPIHVRPVDPKEVMVAAVYEEAEAISEYWNKPNLHFRDMGSAALEMALVANGSFDAFFSPRDFLRVIDIAAATLIIREAGGEVYTSDGKKLDTPFDLASRTSVVAVASDDLLEVLL